MNKVELLAIDIAKNIFQLHGIDQSGNIVLRRRLKREKLSELIINLETCTIAMEACGGSNYWARKFVALGHKVKLISPQFVKPYVKSNKNDRNDSEAICEAASRPNMRFVSPKNIEQQDIQSLHRIRSRLVQERTALVNQIRGLLMEYGIIISQGIRNVRNILPEILEDAENELSDISRRFLFDLYEQLSYKDKKIIEYEVQLKTIFKSNRDCQKIAAIEGVGLITATAIVSHIGDAKVFKNGRHLSAFLGLVPKQHSSGNKQRLLGISKRGDNYIRTLLIHGARAAIIAATNKTDPKSAWIKSIKERRGSNKAAVALANKNARVIWALLAKDCVYKKLAA
jgi:transposase